MVTIYEPMDVEYVRTECGSGPWPPHDVEWSRLDQLRWHAGCVRALTGVTVKFSDGHRASGPGYDLGWPELLGVHVHGVDGFASSQSVDDADVWLFLNGIMAGAEAANGFVKPTEEKV